MVEDIVGCKWSLTVLGLVAAGVQRPGAMQRKVPGLSAKVLNEHLRLLLDYRLITRPEIAGKMPGPDYALTPTGKKLSAIIENIRDLDEEHGAQAES